MDIHRYHDSKAEIEGSAYLVPDEVIVLFAPHHPTQRLSLDISKVVSHRKRTDAPEKFVGLGPSLFDNVIEKLFVEIALVLLGQAKSYNHTFTGRHTVPFVESVPRRTLSSPAMGIDSTSFTIDYVTVKGVFDNYQRERISRGQPHGRAMT